MRLCGSCGKPIYDKRSLCTCVDANGPKREYEECEHDYDEDEDACEYICVLCGDREPMPLDRIMRE